MNLQAIGMSQAEYDAYRPVMAAYNGEAIATNVDWSQRQAAEGTDLYVPSNANTKAVFVYNSRAQVELLDAAGIQNGQFQYGASSGNTTTAGSAGISGGNSGFTSGSAPSSDGNVLFVQGYGEGDIHVDNLQPGVLYTLSMRVAQRAGNNQNLRIYVDGQDLGVVHPRSSDYYDDVTTQAFQVQTPGPHVIRIVGLDTAGGDNTAFVSGLTVNEAAPQLFDGGFESNPLPQGQFAYGKSDGSFSSGGGGGVTTNGSGFTNGLTTLLPEGVSAGFVQGYGNLSWSLNGGTSDTRYRLAFAGTQRPGYLPQDVAVLVDGNEVGRFTPNSDWSTLRTQSFELGPGAHQVTIQGLDSGGGDRTAFIDAVRVETAVASIADGDGNTANIAPGTFQYSANGGAWSLANGAGVAANNAGFTADGGQQSDTGWQLFVQANGTATQTIHDVQGGGSHTFVTFSARQRAGNNQSVGVYVDGALIETITPKNSDYEGFQLDLGALSKGSHQLSFGGLNPQGGDNSALITDVTVSQAGYVDQNAFAHDAFSDDAIAAVVPNMTGTTLNNYIQHALNVAPDCAQTLSLYTDYRQLSGDTAATLYQAAGGMLVPDQIMALTNSQAHSIWMGLSEDDNMQSLFLMQLDAYAPDTSYAGVRSHPGPGEHDAIDRVNRMEYVGDFQSLVTAANIQALQAWARATEAANAVGSGGATTITNSTDVGSKGDMASSTLGDLPPASQQNMYQYGVNNPNVQQDAMGRLPVDAYAPLDANGNAILRQDGFGWDPYTRSYDIGRNSTLMPDGSIVSSDNSLPSIGRVSARNSALPWWMKIQNTADVQLADGRTLPDPTQTQRGLRQGLWNAMQRTFLGQWLKAHQPHTKNEYAPVNMYCTDYVENVYALATGYNLKQAVLQDMASGAPNWTQLVRGQTAANGYRYSSITNIGADFFGADAFNSDNLQNFFARQGWLENIPDAGTGGYSVGDVLFFSGADGKIDHTAMVSAVDALGNPTQIAESTGTTTIYKDWGKFVHDFTGEGLRLTSKGQVNFPVPPGGHFA